MALRTQEFTPSRIDHVDLELYDILYDITSKLGLPDQVRASTYKFTSVAYLLQH